MRLVHRVLLDAADPRALGGAVTVALCGHWEHDGECRWPPALVHDALAAGELVGPDGRRTTWTLR